MPTLRRCWPEQSVRALRMKGADVQTGGVMKHGYWRDFRGNKWSRLLFTRERFERESNTLTDCYDCVNCSHCCGCRGCAYCDDCDDCLNCLICRDCLNCAGCSHCFNCNGCLSAYACHNCGSCYDCAECVGCFHCSDCRWSRGVKSAVGVYGKGNQQREVL